MKRVLKRILKNKTFYIFLLLSIFMFPEALFQQGDKARTAIVTTVGIDKEDDTYEVSILTVIPKGASQLNANLELFSAKDDSVVKALDTIGDSLGKNIGLSHCDCIILSKSVLEEDVCKVFDYFIRNANMSNNASVIVSKTTSKELLEASKSANNLYDLTLKDIVKYSDDDNYNTGMNIESFYKDYYSFDSVAILPLLEVEKSNNAINSSASNSGEPTNTSSGSSSSSGGSKEAASNNGESKNVKNNGESVILKNGKYLNTLSNDEGYIYNLLSPHTKHENITVYGICDNLVTNATETYRVVDKYNFKKVDFKNGKFKVVYYSYLVLKLEEVVMDEYSLKSIEGLEEYITPTVKQNLIATIQNKFANSISEIKRTNQDVLKVGREFYAYKNREWQEFIKNNKDNYLQNIEFNLHIDSVFKI